MINFVITSTMPKFCPSRFASTRCELCGEMLETYKVVKVKVWKPGQKEHRNAIFHAQCALTRKKPIRSHPWLREEATAMRQLRERRPVRREDKVRLAKETTVIERDLETLKARKNPQVDWEWVTAYTRRVLKGTKQ